MHRWTAALLFVAGCGRGPDAAGVDARDQEAPATCDERPPARAGVFTDLALTPTLAGQEIRLGQAIAFGGRQVRFSAVRFFVSQVALLRAGLAVPADLLDRQEKTLPYGVQLIDLDHPETTILRLRAPPGRYDGIAVGIGVPATCNGGDPAGRLFPLDAGGGMAWMRAPGYMFVRLEGSVASGAVSVSFAAHGGVQPPDAGPVPVTAAGALLADPDHRALLQARLDELIEPATSGEHLSAGMAVMARLTAARFLTIGGERPTAVRSPPPR
jgi:hypothetical protein